MKTTKIFAFKRFPPRDIQVSKDERIVMHQKEDKKKLMNAARERARAQL